MARKEVTTIRLTPGMIDRLDALAGKRGESRTVVIQRLLETALDPSPPVIHKGVEGWGSLMVEFEQIGSICWDSVLARLQRHHPTIKGDDPAAVRLLRMKAKGERADFLCVSGLVKDHWYRVGVSGQLIRSHPRLWFTHHVDWKDRKQVKGLIKSLTGETVTEISSPAADVASLAVSNMDEPRKVQGKRSRRKQTKQGR